MERSLTMREDGRGMVHLHARLDPESAAPVKAAIEALVSDVLRRREPADGDRAPSRMTDGRSRRSRPTRSPRSPATRSAAPRPSHRSRRPRSSSASTSTRSSAASGTRASTARPADLRRHRPPHGRRRRTHPRRPRRSRASRSTSGRAARLFSRAQRLALGERDGGCASCGQNIAYVEAHHIAWWERDTGPTDLSNGVLLCSFCHHMIHRDGWKIRASPDRCGSSRHRTSIRTRRRDSAAARDSNRRWR